MIDIEQVKQVQSILNLFVYSTSQIGLCVTESPFLILNIRLK